jgi:3-deoxy-D-manno-octulosonate 8-phosphate phosphatase (KDO 8-P phosphatase)
MQPYKADPSAQVMSALNGIKALIFPVDGVLNNGTLSIDGEGREICSVSVRDVVAIREALLKGLHVAVISGRQAEGYRPLLEKAGLTDLYLDEGSKLDAFEAFKKIHDLQDEDCACIADDIIDIDILRKAGFPVTPINGAEYLRNRVAYISVYEGGKGCIREIVEMILEHQGKWEYGEKQEQEEVH